MTNLHQSDEIEVTNLGFLAQTASSDFTKVRQEESQPTVSMDPFFSPPIVNISLSIGVIFALTFFVKALGELVHPPK
jgi:hypothetical protein